MKKLLFSIVIASLSVFTISAQCPGGGGGGGGTTGGGSSSGSGSISTNPLNSGFTFLNQNVTQSFENLKLSYAQINGSPFLNSKPITGKLVTNLGIVLENIPLQIDLYSNHIIATNEDGEQIILDGKFYDAIILPYEGEELVFKKLDSKNTNKFYQVLHDDGNIAFFKKDNVRLVEGSDNGYRTVGPKFKSSQVDYLIKMGDEEIVNVKLKKKDIFSILPDAELMAMKDYAKRNGIKLKDESDFVAAFAAIND